jgi:hypothetical protein
VRRRCFFAFVGGCGERVNEQGYCEVHLAGCRARAIWHGQYKPALRGVARLPGAWQAGGNERVPARTEAGAGDGRS